MQGMNPMGLSDPWSDSLEIISLQQVKKNVRVNPIFLSDPWANSLDIISLRPVQNYKG